MIDQSCMVIPLFQNIQKLELHKQDDKNSSSSISSIKNRQQERRT